MADVNLVLGLLFNLFPATNVLAIGDYMNYRSNSAISEYSRNVGLVKMALFALIFMSMLAAGHSAADCASKAANEQKDCALGAAKKSGGAAGILALSSYAMPILGVTSIVLSAYALFEVKK